MLAFLGAGHTPKSGTQYSVHVRNAVEHLLSLQDESGAFGSSSAYGHGISTYALCECYGITKDETETQLAEWQMRMEAIGTSSETTVRPAPPA